MKRTMLKSAARWGALLVFILWFGAMFLLTWAVAADMQRQVKDAAMDFAMDPPSREAYLFDSYSPELPGDMEVNVLHMAQGLYTDMAIDKLFPLMTDPVLWGGLDEDSPLFGKWNLVFGFEPAVVYFEDWEHPVAQSGSFLSFCYSVNEYGKTPQGRAYIDLDAVPGAEEAFAGFLKEPQSARFLYNGAVNKTWQLRLYGRFQGNRFCPVRVDRCYGATHTWENILALEDTSDEPLVIVYGWDIKGFCFDGEPLRVDGVEYDSLTQYLLDRDRAQREDDLLDTVISYGKRSGRDAYGDYQVSIAIRCRPVQYALLRLWPAYLISALVAGLGLLLYLKWLKKRIVDPVTALSSAVRYGNLLPADGKLREIAVLQGLLSDMRQEAAETAGQLHRLEAALDYAKNAEENRRRLVSDITHELKTPLAVIHSYAEYLLEGVSPEKRERYLAVILEEARNMDATVLQMLELSRLEAGKVRLSQDTVSLLDITKRTLEKFAPLLETKSVTVSWTQADDFAMTADEVRMGQAITNLLSNAVKYTPAGGRITVGIRLADREAVFSVENTAQPLSEEDLEKVWDSFYRADPSRSEPGTGLGLSLVKNIIRLHGGTCFARNTSLRQEDKLETAVEFGFRIQLR